MPSRGHRKGTGEPPKKRTRQSKTGAGPTIVDVAKAAGVSTATVSRVLSNPGTVLDSTLKHVQSVIAKLDYSPNAAAKSLRTLQSSKLLVIVPDIAEPFFALVLQGIEQAATREGYAVLVGDTQNELDRDQHYATMLPRREVDGLIVLSQKIPTVIMPWMKSHRTLPPVVTGFISGKEFGVSSASIDNVAVAREALEHLYGLGHTHIGVIAGPAELPQVQDRIRGIKACASARRLTDSLSIEHGKFAIEAGITCGAKLLAQSPRPTAIMCLSDAVAVGALEVARRVGLAVPRDLSVIGCDDIPMAAHLAPALTTIALPMREVGREAVRLVVGTLRGHITKPVHTLLPFDLMNRHSTAAPLVLEAGKS
jgi:LacI family repressor for deo operon, udp, cdd, tsx, nupC, and nupG